MFAEEASLKAALRSFQVLGAKSIVIKGDGVSPAGISVVGIQATITFVPREKVKQFSHLLLGMGVLPMCIGEETGTIVFPIILYDNVVGATLVRNKGILERVDLAVEGCRWWLTIDLRIEHN